MAHPRPRLPDRRLVRTYSKKRWSVSQASPIIIKYENTLPKPASLAVKVGLQIALLTVFFVGVTLIAQGFAQGKPVARGLIGGAWIVIACVGALGVRFIYRRVDHLNAEYQAAYVDPIEIELSPAKVRHRGLDKTRRAWVDEELGGYRLRLLSRKVRKQTHADTIGNRYRTVTYQDIVLENVNEPAKSIFLYGEPGHRRSQCLMDNAQRIAETTGLALIESAVPPS